MKLVVKSRGEQLRKALLKHISTIPDNITIESKADELRKENYGRLLLDLNIKELRQKYLREKAARGE